jgi:uncharacterized protein YhhL (DUF1145 family)
MPARYALALGLAYIVLAHSTTWSLLWSKLRKGMDKEGLRVYGLDFKVCVCGGGVRYALALGLAYIVLAHSTTWSLLWSKLRMGGNKEGVRVRVRV